MVPLVGKKEAELKKNSQYNSLWSIAYIITLLLPIFIPTLHFSSKFDTGNVLVAWNMKPVFIYVTQEIRLILKYLPHHYIETSDFFYYYTQKKTSK
jgi:hypothetical protein